MATVLNQDNFDSFVAAQTPTLVDLWATWCGPCRMLAPVVEELEENMGEKLQVGKVDVDQCPELAMRYRVTSIPTLLLFKKGELVDRSIGYVELDELTEFVEKALE